MLKPGLAPRIALQSGRRWPVPGQSVAGIKVTATAGFGPNWNHVPPSLRQAVLMLASYLYANRGDEVLQAGNPIVASGAASLLVPHRERRL